MGWRAGRAVAPQGCAYTPHAAITTSLAAAISGRESVIEPGTFISTGSTQLSAMATSGLAG
jgi:hypothetical protein